MFQTIELVFFLRPQTELKSEASKQVRDSQFAIILLAE